MRQEPISPYWVLRLEAPGSVAAGLDPAQSPIFAPASPSGAEPGVLELARGSGRLPLSRAAELCAIAHASGAPLHFTDSGDGVLEADAETRALLDSLMRHALAVDDMPDARETPPLGARKAPGAQAEPVPKAPEPGLRRWALGKSKRQAEPPPSLLEESTVSGSAVIAFRVFSISLWYVCGLSGPAASGEALRLVERAWAKVRVR